MSVIEKNDFVYLWSKCEIEIPGRHGSISSVPGFLLRVLIIFSHSGLTPMYIIQMRKVQVTQLCPTIYDPMDYTVHGILQARSLSLLQGLFPTQGSKPGLHHCRQILYQLSHKGSPQIRTLSLNKASQVAGSAGIRFFLSNFNNTNFYFFNIQHFKINVCWCGVDL